METLNIQIVPFILYLVSAFVAGATWIMLTIDVREEGTISVPSIIMLFLSLVLAIVGFLLDKLVML